jgi:hypothetical protein
MLQRTVDIGVTFEEAVPLPTLHACLRSEKIKLT